MKRNKGMMVKPTIDCGSFRNLILLLLWFVFTEHHRNAFSFFNFKLVYFFLFWKSYRRFLWRKRFKSVRFFFKFAFGDWMEIRSQFQKCSCILLGSTFVSDFLTSLLLTLWNYKCEGPSREASYSYCWGLSNNEI